MQIHYYSVWLIKPGRIFRKLVFKLNVWKCQENLFYLFFNLYYHIVLFSSFKTKEKKREKEKHWKAENISSQWGCSSFSVALLIRISCVFLWLLFQPRADLRKWWHYEEPLVDISAHVPQCSYTSERSQPACNSSPSCAGIIPVQEWVNGHVSCDSGCFVNNSFLPNEASSLWSTPVISNWTMFNVNFSET